MNLSEFILAHPLHMYIRKFIETKDPQQNDDKEVFTID